MQRLGTAFLVGLLLAASCKTPPPPPAPRLAPDKDSLAGYRNLAARIEKAPEDEAGRLSIELARRRLALLALASASDREDLLIAAGSASEALGPCIGIRDRDCELAITAQVRKNLLVADQSGKKKEAEEYWALLDAIEGAARGETSRLAALAALAQRTQSFVGQVAMIYGLSRLSLAWARAAQGPAALAAPRLAPVRALVCPENACPAHSFSSYDSPANQTALAVLSQATLWRDTLQQTQGELGDAARQYVLAPVAEVFARPVPLALAAPQLDGLPEAAVWRECSLAAPTPEGTQPNRPRAYVVLRRKNVSLGLPPALSLKDGKPALTEAEPGASFPGVSVGDIHDAGLRDKLQEAATRADTARGLSTPATAIALWIEPGASVDDLVLLAKALREAGFRELDLLVKPSSAPKDPTAAVFGASVPLRFEEKAGVPVVEVRGAERLGVRGVAGESTAEGLRSKFPIPPWEFPSLWPAPGLDLRGLLGAWEAIRQLDPASFSSVDKAPLRLAL